MLCANMEAAERIEESAELITAAEIAPSPIVDTAFNSFNYHDITIFL